MPVYVIDTLKPKNGLDFPIVEAVDVAVEGYSSLADAVSHFATDTAIAAINTALDLKADKTTTASLQSQIDQIAQAAGTGSADTEVAQARVGVGGITYNTLKNRLDAGDAKLAAVDSELRFVPKKNLIDFSACTMDKELINTKGGTGTKTGWYVTDWIEVQPNTDYVISGISSAYKVEVNSDKSESTTSQNIPADGHFVTNANTRFVRFNSVVSGYTTPQLEKGTAATAYEPYALTSGRFSEIEEDLQAVSDIALNLEDIAEEGVSPKNLKQNITLEDIQSGKSVIDNMKITNYTPGTGKLDFVSHSNHYLVKIDLKKLSYGVFSSEFYNEPFRALIIAKGENDDEYVNFSSYWSSLASVSPWLTVDMEGNWSCDIGKIKSTFPQATCLYIAHKKGPRPVIVFDGSLILPSWITPKQLDKDPELILPSKSTALVGHEWNIYFDNVITYMTDEHYIRTSVGEISRATLLSDCLRITPTVSDIGNHTVTITVMSRYTNQAVAIGSFTLEVLADEKPINKKVIFIGDSLTAAGIYPAEIQHYLSDGGIISIGTRSDTVTIYENPVTVNHEGRSGWATYDYTRTVPNYNTNYENPFYDGEKFSFSFYMQEQGYSGLDAVVIGLGTNGQGSTSSIEALKIIIDSIHEYDPDIPVILSLVAPPATQDGCGINNGMQNAKDLKDSLLKTVRIYIERYEGNADYSFVHFAELYFALDRRRDFNTVDQPASARNPQIVTRQNNNVHPSKYGYLKFADVYYSNLLGLLS